MKRLIANLAIGLALLVCGVAQAAAIDWATKVDSELLAGSAGARRDFLVELKDKADLSAAAQARTRADKTRAVYQALTAVAARSQAGLLTLLEQRAVPHQAFWIANVISANGTRADIEAIARRDDVRHVYRILEQALRSPVTRATAAKAGEGVEPGLAVVRAPEVWALGFRGQGVVVADHDIGVMWDHPALKRQYRGWDGATADHRYNWHNSFRADPFCADLTVPCDSHGHGTHTTGTMVGDDGEGNQIGMAPAARWIACRSLLDPVAGAGTVPTYMECMEWTLAPYPPGDTAAADPAMAPDIVSNSWGCVEGCAPPVLQDVNDAVYAAGILQIASAGNDGSQCSTIAFPLAVYENTFTVGATDNSDAMAGFSSRGPVLSDGSIRTKPNVVAPGVDTYSSSNDGGYASLSGTSMSSPHVAGLAALLMSAEPRLVGRLADVRTLIERTSVPIATTQVCGGTGEADIPNNIFGYGRVDAFAAVVGRPQLRLAAQAPGTATPGQAYGYSVTVSQPETVKLDATGVVLTVVLPAGVERVSSSEAPASDDPLRFSRATLAPGEAWTVQLQVRSADAGTRTIASSAEADQVSPTPGGVVGTVVAAPVVAAVAPVAPADRSRFGGALGLWLVLAGLALGLARRA
ncbi:MAG TPA: S8 family serine peptidase [Solimonas sp.]|nr:S8 family serine peptidase [Solimonas sp.]